MKNSFVYLLLCAISLLSFSTLKAQESGGGHDNLFGFTGSLSFDVIQTSSINSGIRFDMLTSINQGSFDCDSMQLGIYLGFKF